MRLCRLAFVVLLAGLASLSDPVFAQDPEPTSPEQDDSASSDDTSEFWPELNLFTTLNPTTRFYFVAANTKGKESTLRTLDLAGFVDFTVGPHLQILQVRRARQKEDWQTKKYFWARIGFDHIFKAEDGSTTKSEERGIVALHARYYLPGAILLEGRTRADLRWIGDDYSTRYRLRLEVNRDFTLRNRVITPYLQAENFYDTRYDGWARQLYQVGAEIGVGPHFRVEPYVARQLDRLPSDSALTAFALVARWYY